MKPPKLWCFVAAAGVDELSQSPLQTEMSITVQA